MVKWRRRILKSKISEFSIYYFSIICSMAGKGANGIEVTWQRHSSGRKQVHSWVITHYSTLFCLFLQECPSGMVNEETFKHIYSQFFPHGGKKIYIYVYCFSKVIISRKRLTYSFFFVVFLQMRACMHTTYSTHLTQRTMAPSNSRYESVCFDTLKHAGLYKFVYSGRRPGCFIIGKGWFFLFFFLTEWTESVR